jgi:hypothetical protein
MPWKQSAGRPKASERSEADDLLSWSVHPAEDDEHDHPDDSFSTVLFAVRAPLVSAHVSNMSHTPDPCANGISINDYCKLLPDSATPVRPGTDPAASVQRSRHRPVPGVRRQLPGRRIQPLRGRRRNRNGHRTCTQRAGPGLIRGWTSGTRKPPGRHIHPHPCRSLASQRGRRNRHPPDQLPEGTRPHRRPRRRSVPPKDPRHGTR